MIVKIFLTLVFGDGAVVCVGARYQRVRRFFASCVCADGLEPDFFDVHCCGMRIWVCHKKDFDDPTSPLTSAVMTRTAETCVLVYFHIFISKSIYIHL